MIKLMSRPDLEKARKKLERARNKYLNGPHKDRRKNREIMIEVMKEYERQRTGHSETLQERWRRLTK